MELNNEISEDIVQAAQSACNELIPEKSSLRYNNAYNEFMEWNKAKKGDGVSETVLLAYFFNMSTLKKPTSLWAYYSMLKSTIKVKHNIDIGNYYKLVAFLKSKQSGYKPTQAKVFTEENIKQFICNAPDSQWLIVKVSMRLG